jgi:hypothetical protein
MDNHGGGRLMIFRDISIPFHGREYIVTPSNKLLRRIEMKGRREDPSFNLVAVFVRGGAGSGAFYEMAFVLAELINSTGANVTEDDALAQFVGFKSSLELSEYIALLCSCVMPELRDDGKKPIGAETEAA